MADVLALVAFLLGGVPSALVFFSRIPALLASALFSTVFATASAGLHVLTGASLVLLWTGFVVVCSAIAFGVPRLRRRAVIHLRATAPTRDYVQLAVVAIVAVLAVAFTPAPLLWDARSIWLFHASWLAGSAQDFVNAQHLSTLAFSHPNYPLLLPASMAVGWGLAGGGEDLLLGVRIDALISILTVALAGWIGVRRIAPNAEPVIAVVAYTGFLTGSLAISDGVLTSGYADPLQAAGVVLLIAQLLSMTRGRVRWSDSIVAALAAVAAANVKQEGFWFVLIVLVAYLILTLGHHNLASYLPLAATAVSYVLWRGLLVVAGGSDTTDASGIGGRIGELFGFSSPAWQILRRLLLNEGRTTLLPLLLVVLVFLAAFLWQERTARSIRIAALLLASWLGFVATIFLTYALGDTRDRIDWWLSTSFSRIVATNELLTWFVVLVAVAALARRGFWKKAATPIEGPTTAPVPHMEGS